MTGSNADCHQQLNENAVIQMKETGTQNRAENPSPFPEEVGRAMYEKDQNSHHCGIRLIEVGKGFAKVSMNIENRMLNGNGYCHGGMLFTLADTAFSYACNSYNRISVAQHCSITFLIPVSKGDFLTATAEENQLIGKNGIYDIDVKNQHGLSKALFRGHSRSIRREILNTGGDNE